VGDRPLCSAYAFTLIEMLIVVVILGVLAMLVVPQLADTADDAERNALRENLSLIRRAIEIYRVQHNNTYPGRIRLDATDKANGRSQTPDEAVRAFVLQLSRYSAVDGSVSVTKDATYRFGPYNQSGSVPVNPFIENRDVRCDIVTADITQRHSDGRSAWKFYVLTGVFIANDGAHDSL
jgi:general secretion pathway protein G